MAFNINRYLDEITKNIRDINTKYKSDIDTKNNTILNELNTDYSNLQNAIKNPNNTHAAYNLIAVITFKLDSIQGILIELEITKKNSEIKELTTEISNANADFIRAQEELKKQIDDKAAADKKAKGLMDEIQSLAENAGRQEAKLEEMRKKIKENNTEQVSKLQEQINIATNNLIKQHEDLLEKQNDLNKLNEDIANRGKFIDEAVINAKQIVIDYKTKLEEITTETNKLQAELEKKEKEKSELIKKTKSIGYEIGTLQEEIQKVETLREETKRILEEKNNILTNINNEITSANNNLKKLEKERNAASGELTKLQGEIETLNAEKQTIEAKINQTKLLNTDIVANQILLDRLKKEIANKTIIIANKTNEIANKTNEIKKLGKNYDDNNALNDALQKKLNEISNEISEKEANKSKLDNEISNLTVDKEKLQNEVQSKSTELKHSETQLHNLKQKQDELSKSNTGLLNQNKTLENNNNKIKQIILDTLAEGNYLLKQKQEEINTLDYKINNMKNTYKTEEDEMVKQINTANALLKAINVDIISKQQELNDKNVDMSNKQRQLEEKEKILKEQEKTLQQKSQEEQHKFQEEKMLFQEEQQKFQKEKKIIESENISMKELLQTKEANIGELNKEISKLNEGLENLKIKNEKDIEELNEKQRVKIMDKDKKLFEELLNNVKENHNKIIDEKKNLPSKVAAGFASLVLSTNSEIEYIKTIRNFINTTTNNNTYLDKIYNDFKQNKLEKKDEINMDNWIWALRIYRDEIYDKISDKTDLDKENNKKIIEILNNLPPPIPTVNVSNNLPIAQSAQSQSSSTLTAIDKIKSIMAKNYKVSDENVLLEQYLYALRNIDNKPKDQPTHQLLTDFIVKFKSAVEKLCINYLEKHINTQYKNNPSYQTLIENITNIINNTQCNINNDRDQMTYLANIQGKNNEHNNKNDQKYDKTLNTVIDIIIFKIHQHYASCLPHKGGSKKTKRNTRNNKKTRRNHKYTSEY